LPGASFGAQFSARDCRTERDVAGDDLAQRIGEAILDAPGDAIVYSDAEGVIRFWNSGAERIFGFASAEAIGQSLDLIIPERLRQRHWDGYRTVMETGESRYGAGDLLSVPSVRKDGARISLEFTIAPLRSEDGRMQGIIAVLRDVTARFEEFRALRRELAALKDPSFGR
jgi:PAS domain S-box-containing protein